MRTFKDTFVKFMMKFVFGLFGIIILFLFLLSIFETSKLNIDEIVTYHRDRPLIHILFLVFVCLITAILKKRICIKIPMFYFYGVLFGCLVFWIFATRLYPKADQLQIMVICPHIVEKDYQDFYLGGYLYSQPHQIFMVYFSTILYLLFGKSYVFVFQVMNAFAILGIYSFLLKMYQRFEKHGSFQIFLVVSFLFLPFNFYVTFVYGTVIGLFLSLAALEALLRYMEDFRICHMVSCTVLILFAQLFKSNYLIFLLGFAAVLVFDFIRKVDVRHLLFILVLTGSLLLCNRCMEEITESMTGIHSDGGVPAILFVAMGLTDSENGPGWWTGYHDNTFLKNGFDVERSREIGKKKIREELGKMRKDPLYGVNFFFRKISSEWSEPTYESIWIQQRRKSGTEILEWIDRLIHNGGRLADMYTLYCNLYQSFLYLGTLLFLYVNWKELSFDELFIPVIFIGGFLFHIFWEAKGQYTLPYCVCLLPYCVSGYRGLVKK